MSYSTFASKHFHFKLLLQKFVIDVNCQTPVCSETRIFPKASTLYAFSNILELSWSLILPINNVTVYYLANGGGRVLAIASTMNKTNGLTIQQGCILFEVR
jgi:hypothetical protein